MMVTRMESPRRMSTTMAPATVAKPSAVERSMLTNACGPSVAPCPWCTPYLFFPLHATTPIASSFYRNYAHWFSLPISRCFLSSSLPGFLSAAATYVNAPLLLATAAAMAVAQRRARRSRKETAQTPRPNSPTHPSPDDKPARMQPKPKPRVAAMEKKKKDAVTRKRQKASRTSRRRRDLREWAAVSAQAPCDLDQSICHPCSE